MQAALPDLCWYLPHMVPMGDPSGSGQPGTMLKPWNISLSAAGGQTFWLPAGYESSLMTVSLYLLLEVVCGSVN